MSENVDNPQRGILSKLWKCNTNKSVLDLLKTLSISDSSSLPQGEQYIWKPVGGSLSNAANIQTVDVSIAPIIERITNSYDASIEVKEFENNSGHQMTTNLPNDPRTAIETWWNIPRGDTATYSKTIPNTKRTELANSVVKILFKDSNIQSQPTIIVRDYGIGQTPEDFTSTILKLGNSNKISRPHLHGTYGHGGSSSFRYCDCSIIISRRNPVDVSKDSSFIGWTIVRKNLLIPSNRSIYDWSENKIVQIKQPPVYEYLCISDGSIPRVPISDFPTFHGTYIAHIEYEAREWQNLSRGLGYRLFRNYLFDPVLPFRLEDLREGSGTFRRNMFGARSTLDGSPDVVYRNESLENLEDEGNLLIRYWMLYNESKPSNRPLNNFIERQNSRNTIIVTLNGQRHGTLEKSLISRKCRLPRVADTLLVQIVVDDLDKGMIGELNTSNRGQLIQEGYTTELIQEKLIDCFLEDPELGRWEKKLSEIHAADDESTKEVTRILDQLLDIGIDSGAGSTTNQVVPLGVGTKLKYDPPEPPTEIILSLKADPIEIIKGETRKFNIELNAKNGVFRRRVNRGTLSFVGDAEGLSIVLGTNKFKDGRLPVEIKAGPESSEYDPKKICFIYDADNVPIPLETERYFVIIPPPTYEPVDPPTELKILRGDPIELQIGKINTISLVFNGTNDILTRSVNPASLELECDYSHLTQIRRRGPNDGKIQYGIKVSDGAEINDRFKFIAKLNLSNGSILKDERTCIIIPQKEVNKNKGDTTTRARPNYRLISVRKEDWNSLNWTEENIGLYELKNDDDGKECLYLYINLDSEPIGLERERRVRRSQTQSTIERMDNKYVAHVAYHLFQQFNEEKMRGSYDAQSIVHREENPDTIFTQEQYDIELTRVAKTLVLSLRGITDLSPD